MKRIICMLLSILLITSTMVITVSAESVEVDGILYEFDSESQTYTIVGTNITEPDSYVYLNETINGYAVTKVAPYAFSGTQISVEQFPSCLTEIGENAFVGCWFSCPVDFYEENVTIDSYAFSECSFSGAVNFYGKDITISSYAFYRASFSDVVCLGNPWDSYRESGEIIRVKEYAFSESSFSWYNADSAIVYGDVIQAEPNSFCETSMYDMTVYYSMDFMVDSGMYYAETLRLKGVYTIPSGVFGNGYDYYEKYPLSNIYIDGALGVIEEDTFYFTRGDINVYIDDLANWCYNVQFYDNPLIYGSKLYVNNELLTDLVLPEGGDTVSEKAFEDYMYLESLTVPSHIKKISYRSFLNNNSLTDISISEGLETIEEEGLMFFSDREISLPKSLETIEFIGYWEIIEMLYCYPDSAAQRYAEENNVPYTLYSMNISSENASIDNESMCIMTSDNGVQDIEDIVNISGYTVEATPSYSVNGVELYGTGSVVNIYNNNGEAEGAYTVIVSGDLDGDAVCDVLDVAQAEKIANAHETADIAQIYAANGCVSEKIDVSSYQSVVNTALNS